MGNYDYLSDMTPLLVQVELTEACNLRCRFCYNSQKPRYNRDVYRMMDVLADQGVMQLTLTGGEPLMHPEFFSILEYAVKKFPNVMILSNGSLMNDENVRRISESGVMSVSISIHGTESVHESLTCVRGSYADSMRAIRRYLEIGQVPVASNFVLNAKNKTVLAETAQRFHEMGLQFMTITRFVPVGIGKTAHDLEISRADMVEAMSFADRFMREYEYPNIEFAEAVPHCIVPPELEYLANTCSYGYDRFYVDVAGNLMVCGLSRILLGGNVLERKIADIKKDSAVFSAYLGDTHVPIGCRSCGMFAKCHGGCRAASMRTGEWRATMDSLLEE